MEPWSSFLLKKQSLSIHPHTIGLQVAERALLCFKAVGCGYNSHSILTIEEEEPERIKIEQNHLSETAFLQSPVRSEKAGGVISSCTVENRAVSLLKLSNTKILLSDNHRFLTYSDLFSKVKNIF